jgi:hypothetical protein
MGLHDLLRGWLTLLTLCSEYFVYVSFSRCLLIFAVCYLKIQPNSRLTVNFCNNLIFHGGRLLGPTPNLQAGGTLLVCCLRLLIQFIGSYTPYLEAVFSIYKLRMCHAVVTRDPHNMESKQNKWG